MFGVAAMSRRASAKCGDLEALFRGPVCCSCGADSSAKPKRARRSPRNLVINQIGKGLRVPVIESDSNLTALMRMKATYGGLATAQSALSERTTKI